MNLTTPNLSLEKIQQALKLLKSASASTSFEEDVMKKEPSKYDVEFNSSNVDNDELQTLLEEPKQDKTDKLNPSIAYEIWSSDPSDENFATVLKSVQPTIRYALAANNAVGDNLIETKAKVLAAKAIKSYDPSYGSSLPTYLSTQLQKLTRYTREARSAIKIPERQLYAAAELAKAEEEWKEKHGGKEPTVSDLADTMGLSIKKIEEIRKQFIRQVSERSYFSGATEEDNQSSVDDQSKSVTDFTKEAIGYVYNDLAYRDKKILEYMTGYGGSDILDHDQIAKKMKLSTSQVYRTAAKLANRIYDTRLALEKVYS